MRSSTVYGNFGALGCGCQNVNVSAAPADLALSSGMLRGSGLLRGFRGLGEVKDYDQITIGGQQYSVNSIVGRGISLTAKKDTKIYSGTPGVKVIKTIKAGQSIGSPESYIRADQSSDGNSWLMFYGSKTSVITGENPNASGAYFVPNESVDQSQLKNQGVLTAAQEIKKEQDAKLKEENPVLYYAKKVALPAALVIGAIIIGKAAVTAYINRPKKSAALSGSKKRKKKK